MKIIIFNFIPYSIISIMLSNLNRKIRMIEKKRESIFPDEYAQSQRNHYTSLLATLKPRRDMLMNECYRRSDWVEFEIIDKDIFLKYLKTES